jgi:hypothetical protein
MWVRPFANAAPKKEEKTDFVVDVFKKQQATFRSYMEGEQPLHPRMCPIPWSRFIGRLTSRPLPELGWSSVAMLTVDAPFAAHTKLKIPFNGDEAAIKAYLTQVEAIKQKVRRDASSGRNTNNETVDTVADDDRFSSAGYMEVGPESTVHVLYPTNMTQPFIFPPGGCRA